MENYHSQQLSQLSKTNNLTANSDKLASFQRPGANLAVYMRGVTWLRDSHGLFDYESRSINKKSFKIQSQGKIVRLKDDVEFFPLSKKDEEIDLNALTLFNLRTTPSGFFLENSLTEDGLEDKEDGVNKLWVVIRSLKNPSGKYDYKIKKFDTIKLGRIKFRVKEVSCPGIDQTPEELLKQELKEARHLSPIEPNPENLCRICYSHEQTEENPTILPCKCTGSVGFIHYDCLRQWMQTKMVKKEVDNYLQTFYWKIFECEICKNPYPYSFSINNKLYKLFQMDKPQSDTYIMLESLPLERNTSRYTYCLAVTDSKKEFKMGRGHESEIRVNDISVSRCHAIIKFNSDGNFYVEDNQSKFGSLVLVRDTLKLEQEHTLAVQIGRTVVSFVVRDTSVSKRDRNQEESGSTVNSEGLVPFVKK